MEYQANIVLVIRARGNESSATTQHVTSCSSPSVRPGLPHIRKPVSSWPAGGMDRKLVRCVDHAARARGCRVSEDRGGALGACVQKSALLKTYTARRWIRAQLQVLFAFQEQDSLEKPEVKVESDNFMVEDVSHTALLSNKVLVAGGEI